jgi:hypothetical protein
MAERERGVWSFRLAVVSPVLFLVGPVLANQSLVPPLVGFVLFALGGLLGIAAVIGGVIAMVRAGSARGQRAALIGAIPAALFVWIAAGGRSFPPINDITTDLSDPPAFVHAGTLPGNEGRDFAYPDGFAEVVRAAYPDITTVHIDEPPAKVFDRALLLARGTPLWTITTVDREQLTFEGIATTGIFRFRDDFVVRVRRDGNGSRVDMRSKSRDGKGDLGTNAERIRVFLGKLRVT